MEKPVAPKADSALNPARGVIYAVILASPFWATALWLIWRYVK